MNLLSGQNRLDQLGEIGFCGMDRDLHTDTLS
jgi:hypothetical protein